MKVYWDSSALVIALVDDELRDRLAKEKGTTRTHSLAEVFSTLTGGNIRVRLSPDDAARTVEALAADLNFVDLTPARVLRALREARKRGVRGGRVHDYLHAVAALDHRAGRLLTSDRNDFKGLADGLVVETV